MAKQTTTVKRGGEIDVYTSLLCVAFLVLAAGAVLLALNNIEHSDDDRDPGGPFKLVSGR
jgi:hypothetical protein